MFSDYLRILKAKMILLSPPDPLGNQVISYKSTPSSASPNGKDNIVAGLAFSSSQEKKNVH